MSLRTIKESPGAESPEFLWIDLTRACQLECTHCLNGSGPGGSHGSMSTGEWMDLLRDAAAMGTRAVQLFGGEPTLHPDFEELLLHALGLGLSVEVSTNLVHVPERLWKLFERPGVSLATSYYSADPDGHNAVTGRPSHRRTRANIVQAVERGIGLRAGVIDTGSSQDAESARRDLTELGVHSVRVDRVRPFGRGARHPVAEGRGLCGNCGHGRAAVGPNGDVTPCPFAVSAVAGNVRVSGSFEAIVTSGALAVTASAHRRDPGDEDDDQDAECTPGYPGSSCTPRN
ncbi:radical SAM/SPASM domain-containing protein [Streptomyces koyangensis]|uniref:radical SAM/SPASM domain-containing protein n=1 Tax=Streptomyces koyangensis TaxID=188770 RepID=UPI003C2CF6DC